MSTTEDIRRAVYRALTVYPMIDENDIEVDVLGDTILLNGTVPSQAQVAEATKTTSGVPGTAAVENLLDVALPSHDYGDDAALADEADEALRANAAVPLGVMATVSEGSVTLTHTVNTAAQRAAAEDSVAGVGRDSLDQQRDRHPERLARPSLPEVESASAPTDGRN